MKNSPKTRQLSAEQKRDLQRATTAQIVRQVVLLLVVVALWTGLLVAFLGVAGKTEVPVAEAPQSTEVAVAPEPTPAPTSTELHPTATHTIPAPTETTEATNGPTEPATESPVATDSLTEVPTETEVPPSPTAPPTETETPPVPTDTPTAPAEASVSFSDDVLPILTSRCGRCHGGDGTEAGLNLLSYAGVMAGTENGPVVTPGDSVTSSLAQQIISGEMPRRAPRLPASEIETISTWVDEGAQDN